MLSNEEIEKKLRGIEGVLYVKVEGDGYQYQLTIVSDHFMDKTKLERQRWVYAELGDYITSGRLHAIGMKTWTNKEWSEQRG